FALNYEYLRRSRGKLQDTDHADVHVRSGNDSGRSPQLAGQALELFGNVGSLRRGPLPAPQFGVHDLAHPPAHRHTIRICQSLDGPDRAWRESDRNRSTKGLRPRGADWRT